ncbi:MAG: hypothetical protein ETSY1_19565 [Candidatus Entotheonella factor]|uniref:Response regulatory domain-containing protein n=1 Tax=Entotheonella factor TaxID=1429438 RepID=W4LJF8_ENTF1|nr:MAG: hypothetical protein ETSY1_19565 [Candidatus Entotheonella factor]
MHSRLITNNLRHVGIPNELIVFSESQSLLNFMTDRQPLPALIVLSRELPGFDSTNLLHRLKSDVATQRIPIVIMSNTENPSDIYRCYALGCNAYVVKPPGYRQAQETIRHLGQFFSVIHLPNE